MTCEIWRGKLDAYVDNELGGDEFAHLDQHLRECHTCAAEALNRIQFKRTIHVATARRFEPSPEFRARVRASLEAKPKRTKEFRWMPALGFAFAALILVLAGILTLRNWQRQQQVAELLDVHISTLASANPVDVVSTDRHTVKPWFQGKLPFTFNLPELANSPFKLVGGRVFYLHGVPGAQLLFELRSHRISVFILQGKRPDAPFFNAERSERGFSMESWQTGDLLYVAASDASPADVRALADLLRSAARQ